jgi:pantothenate kinase
MGTQPTFRFEVGELASRARELRNRSDGRVVLGITGPPGAGKSTVTAALASELGHDAVVVPMDGFHLSSRVLRDFGALDRKGAPDTFDAAGYVALLDRVRAGKTAVYAPSFRREIDEPIANDVLVSLDVKIVLTEGNYLLTRSHGWREVRSRLDAVWYVDVEPKVRVKRLAARHAKFGKDPESAERWALGPDEINSRLVERSRSLADAFIVLDTE